MESTSNTSQASNSMDQSHSDSGSELQQAAEFVGFAVEPKTNCPHFSSEDLNSFRIFMKEKGQSIIETPCESCQSTKENWGCLSCNKFFCSRYIAGHTAKHIEATAIETNPHTVVFSVTDASFWCYPCESYIMNPPIKEFLHFFSDFKFAKSDATSPDNSSISNSNQTPTPKQPHKENTSQLEKLINMMKGLMGPSGAQTVSEPPKPFTYEDLISGLSASSNPSNSTVKREFTKIVFLTGAGISVSAGIPDFRTPGSGLYSQLEKYQLPFPEAIFEINYFKESPQAFYRLSKEFLTCGSHPTISHFFIAEIHRRNQLLINFSQNIDGLEIEAGLPEHKLVQAHGHFRTAKCTLCKQVADIERFRELAKQDQIYYCSSCTTGIVKPDIVFFGEQLPKRFFDSTSMLDQADLVFVIGTSLKVFPFASLVSTIDSSVPIVLVNRENPGIKRKNFLFMEGDIDDSIEKILTDVKWDFPKITRNYPAVAEDSKTKSDSSDKKPSSSL